MSVSTRRPFHAHSSEQTLTKVPDCLVMDNFSTIKYGLIRNCESSQSFNLRYLNEEASKEFKVMVHSLSSLIGLKRAVLYVDGCISDLFDGLSSRISHQRFVYDIEHSRWMERYFGYGVLAYFVSNSRMVSSLCMLIFILHLSFVYQIRLSNRFYQL